MFKVIYFCVSDKQWNERLFSIQFEEQEASFSKRSLVELLTEKCTYVGHYVAISRVHCQGHHLDEPARIRVRLPITIGYFC